MRRTRSVGEVSDEPHLDPGPWFAARGWHVTETTAAAEAEQAGRTLTGAADVFRRTLRYTVAER